MDVLLQLSEYVRLCDIFSLDVVDQLHDVEAEALDQVGVDLLAREGLLADLHPVVLGLQHEDEGQQEGEHHGEHRVEVKVKAREEALEDAVLQHEQLVAAGAVPPEADLDAHGLPEVVHLVGGLAALLDADGLAGCGERDLEELVPVGVVVLIVGEVYGGVLYLEGIVGMLTVVSFIFVVLSRSFFFLELIT